MLYTFITGMTKISLLYFFLRVFTSGPLRRMIHATIIVSALFVGTFILVVIFQCSPVNHTWLYWDKEHPGKCVNINAAVWALAIINILLDVFIILLPIPELYKLNMPLKKKISLIFVFALGFL